MAWIHIALLVDFVLQHRDILSQPVRNRRAHPPGVLNDGEQFIQDVSDRHQQAEEGLQLEVGADLGRHVQDDVVHDHRHGDHA